MKESKAVHVTKRDISWYANNNIVNTIEVNKYKLTNDAGVQYNSKRDNIFYANRNVSNVRRYYDHDLRYFNPIPKPMFAYSRSKSFTDIGVGSVKALQKKKVKRIYLPETNDRGVGSSDLTSFITRIQSVQNKNKAAKQYKSAQSYYESKRTSSKCVGGALEYRPECLVSAKVSPIIHTQSGSTSPKVPGLTNESKESKDVDIGTEKRFVTTDTQFEEPEIKVEAAYEAMKDEVKEILAPKVDKTDDVANTPKHSTEAIVAAFKISPPETKSFEAKFAVTLPQNKSEGLDPLKGSFSSDSLVQHVHNLEQPSEYSKQRDPMENKMEREYRKMFGSVSRENKILEKQQIPQKSTSLFRRRFTAIKKSLGKKESKNEDPKQATVPCVKDASVSSDPPSLEEISMSSINGYRSNKKKAQRKTSYKTSYTGKKSSKINPIDSEYNQGVKGMFKLWGKKFNLEDSSDTKDDLTQPSSLEKQNTEHRPNEKGAEPKILVEPVLESNEEEKIYDKGKEKKEGKKFLFFKKKQSKDKTKNQNLTYKNKKGVMTGRCEVKEGLTLRMGGAARAPSQVKSKTPPPPALIKKEKSFPIEAHNDLVKTAWLMKFLSNPIESRNSVKVRWNNRTYTTSSSTVFELMGNVYKDPGAVLKSKSLITTDASSTWSYYRPNVNFDQKIEAWMIPTTILDHKSPMMPKNTCNQHLVSCINSKSKIDSNNVEVSILDAKPNSKAFARNEVVLHSKNFVKFHKPETSAEYIRIDIPKGYFSDTSSDGPQPGHSSDEEVYNIVEYESGNCSPAAKHAERRTKEFNPSDHSKSQTIHVTVSVKSTIYEETKIMETVIKKPVQRDVVIQGSNVYIPKICDVIGVGIITQRDVREVGKPKFKEYLTEEESEHSCTKPCPSKKAKSYLEEYYRHFEPLEMDMFLWCHSDSHMQCCSDNNSRGSYHNGEAAKSCPNIYEDYITLSSLMSSWSSDQKNKCKVKKNDWGILPKDSLIVSKKRRIFAKRKAKWIGEYSNPRLISSSDMENPKRVFGKKKAKICPNPCTILESKSGSIIHAPLRPCIKRPSCSPSLPSCCPPSPCPKPSSPCVPKPPSPCPKPCSKPPSPLSTCLPCPKSPPCSKDSSPPPCPKPPPLCIKPTPRPKPPSPPCSKPPSPPCTKPPSPPCAKPPSPCCKTPSPPCSKPPSPTCKFNSIQFNSKPCRTPPRNPTGIKISNADSMILPSPVKYGSPCQSPKTLPCKPETPPCPAKTPPCPPKTPPCPTKFPPCPLKTPPSPPKSPPLKTQPSPPKNPPCPSEAPTCPHQTPFPPKTLSRLPKPPPCPYETQPCPPKTPPCPPKAPPCPPKTPPYPYKPPPCPYKTPPKPPLNCMSPRGSPPKSPRSSYSSCSPPRCPHGIEVSIRSPTLCSPKRRLSITTLPTCNSPDKCPHGVKITNCDIYDCPALQRPRPPDCSSKSSQFISKEKKSPTNSCCHAPSHRLMHVSTPPSPLQCACSRTKMSVQMIMGDVPSIESTSKSFCDDDSPDIYEDQGDYFAEECTNVVMKSQSEPQQCPVDYDDDTELTSTFPRSQPNFGIRMNKFPRKITDYKIPNLKRLNSRENVMLKHNHGNVSNHNIFNDPQSNQITVNEIASVERDKKETVCNDTDSVINMIEINFKLRVLHGDKMTEINTAINEDPIIASDKKSNKYFDHDAKEVYILKDDDAAEEVNSQNDLNIRIIIKNCKTKEPSKEKKAVDVFAEKISEKLKTVSTGYSVDFKGENPVDTGFSVHRATIDLTTSDRSVTSILLKKSEVTVIDSKKTRSDENNLGVKSEVLSGQAISLTKKFASVTKVQSISETVPMNSTSQGSGLSKPKSNELSVHSAIYESHLSRKRVKHASSNPLQLSSTRSIPKKISRSNEDYSLVDNKLVTFKESKKSANEKFSLSDTDEHDISVGNKTSEEPTSKSLVGTSEDHTDPTDFAKSSDSDTKHCAVLIERVPTEEIEYINLGKTKKEEKKEMLKAVFDTTKYFNKPKSRSKMQRLKDMLKVLLTSDTDSDTDHGYQKLVTDTAKCIWDPKVKHNSDSLNNFFEGGSLLISQSLTKSPIETFNSLQSDRSAFSEDEKKPQNKTCLCSNFAEKLNLENKGGCCCCKSALPEKISEQISCNFVNEKITLEDYGYYAPSVECVHCQTNNSRYKGSSSAIKIVSMCSKKSSLIPHSRETSSIKSHSQEETYLFDLETEPLSSKMNNKSYEQEKKIKDSTSGDGDLLQENSDNAGNEAVPYSQEEMHQFDLETEQLGYKISNKSYEQDRKLKDNSYRNAENEPVSDKMSIESHENERKLKKDSSHKDLLLEEVNMHEDEPNSSSFTVESHKSEKAYSRKSSCDNHFQEIEVQKYNSTKYVRINETENVLFEDSVNKTGKPDTNRKKKKHYTIVKNQADVLQMYETKKAVLEIYAEKTVTDDGEHLVAKLPKYVRDTEGRLYESYEQIEKSSEYKSVYKRNFVMMCIGR